MTEEEREKAQDQLTALTQAYSELSQHCSDQTTAVEEVRLPVERLSYQLENSATCWTRCMTNRFLLLCHELTFAASVFLLERIQTRDIQYRYTLKYAVNMLCCAPP